MSEINSVRISTFSRDKNISINKIFDILKEFKINIDNNPNQKLTQEQIQLINNYLDKEKNLVNNYQTENEDNFYNDQLNNSQFLDNNDTELDQGKSEELFKTYGFIDPSKLSIKTNKKSEKNINQKKINNSSATHYEKYLKKNSSETKYYGSKHANSQTNNKEKPNPKKVKANTLNNNYKNKEHTEIRSIKEIKNEIRKYKQLKIEKINKRLKKGEDENSKNKKKVSIPLFTTLEILSKLLDIKINELTKKCKDYGLNVLPSQKLDRETITIIADDYNFSLEFQEDLLKDKLTTTNDNLLKPRIPIVTVMGHIDHGKTTFLDYIRKTNITKSEKGGITQHLGAYKIKTSSDKEMVFLDTPGHEAFANMRSIGCDVADVVIVIIAADDGVKKQTKEALTDARNHNLPIVFAFNKIDKSGINIDKVKEELSKLNFLVEDWGGEYQYQEISAKTGEGIEKLLDKVLTEAYLLDLKADFEGSASGTVIESTIAKGKGYLNNVIVKSGKLKVGDFVIIGTSYGKIKMLIDSQGNTVKESYPSDPVQIVGLSFAAVSGDSFYVVNDEKEAKKTVLDMSNIMKQKITTNNTSDNIDNEKLNVIIRSDVIGTSKALADSLKKLSDEFVEVRVISYGIGNVTETDILLAETTKSTILTFNVKNPGSITKFAKDKSVQIVSYDVIYDIIDYVNAVIKKMKSKNKIEKYVGKAEIKAIFDISKVGKIAGCVVLEGPIFKKNLIKVIRGDNIIYSGEIKTIKHKKAEMESIKTLDECGICIKNFEDFIVGDYIEFYDLVDNE